MAFSCRIRPMPRLTGLAVALTAALAALTGLLPGPLVERVAADGREAEAARLERQLSAAEDQLRRAGIQAERAVQAYDGAQVRRVEAAREAEAAARRAALAEAARAAAAEDATRLAAEAYRLGGSPELAIADALFTADGPVALADRAKVLQNVSRDSRRILDTATATARLAAAAADRARAAQAAATRAAQAVREAEQAAERELADQQAQVARLTTRRDRALAELAAARGTTMAQERSRQQALAERRARAGAGAGDEPAPGGDAPESAGATAAIAFARAQLGRPYIWGGEGPRGYDCSGLTMMAWRRGGKALTHFAATQFAQSTPVTYGSLRPGDLIFWSDTGRAAGIYHVALYIGGDQMIEAPRPGAVIKQASIWLMGTPDFYARP